MKVLVTGATGFVGAAVVRALLDRGDEVYAVSRETSDRRRLVDLADLRWVACDLLDERGVERLAEVGADVCVHSAWYAEPGKYLSSVVNIDLLAATLRLARTLALGGCRRFVGIGSCFEYDTERGLLCEDTPLAPVHLYSAAKAAAYMALKQLGVTMGMAVAWARLFYLYGPDEAPSRLVPSITRALLRGEEARCTPGAQVRDFLHVEDAGEALGAIAHSDVVDAINVASGQPVTVAAVARQLGVLCDRPDLVRLGVLPYGPTDPMFVCADVRRLVRATGWTPRWSLGDGLGGVVEWWRRALVHG